MNTGLILFLIFIPRLVVRVPMSISLNMASLTTVVFEGLPASSAATTQKIFGELQFSSTVATTFFILAGNLIARGEVSGWIIDFADCLVGNARGGTSLALVLACIFFTALSESAPTTIIATGATLYGNTIKEGYPGPWAVGLLAVSGRLGPIIPPSIIMVIYCMLTDASVGNMLEQGMVIDIVVMLVLMVEVLWFARKEKWPKQNVRRMSAGVAKVLLDAILTPSTPITILGEIYSGMLTATESAAVTVIWATIAGTFIYRELDLPDIIQIIKDSTKNSVMILFTIAASTAFSWVFTISGASKALVDMVIGVSLDATIFCLVVAVILLIFGTSMEGTAITILLVPVLWPIAQSMSINVVHLGTVVCISSVVGTMVPPIAVNIYSVAAVSELKMGEITRAEIPSLVGYVGVFFPCVFSEWFCILLT